MKTNLKVLLLSLLTTFLGFGAIGGIKQSTRVQEVGATDELRTLTYGADVIYNSFNLNLKNSIESVTLMNDGTDDFVRLVLPNNASDPWIYFTDSFTDILKFTKTLNFEYRLPEGGSGFNGYNCTYLFVWSQSQVTTSAGNWFSPLDKWTDGTDSHPFTMENPKYNDPNLNQSRLDLVTGSAATGSPIIDFKTVTITGNFFDNGFSGQFTNNWNNKTPGEVGQAGSLTYERFTTFTFNSSFFPDNPSQYGNKHDFAKLFGSLITINGQPLSNFGVCHYLYATKHLTIEYSENALTPTQEYSNTILEFHGGLPIYQGIVPNLKFVLNNETNEWNLITKVEYDGINNNNNDYWDVVPTELAVPVNGYCLMIRMNKALYQSSGTAIKTNITAYGIGNLVKFDDEPLSSLEGSIICYPAASVYIYVYIPKTFATGVRHELVFEDGAIFGVSILPHMRFVLCPTDGLKWTYSEMVSSHVAGIEWNGTSYSGVFPGNGILTNNSAFISNVVSENNSSSRCTVNFAKSEFGNHVKLNGVKFSEINDATIQYFNSGFIYFYCPNFTKVGNVFEIEEGAKFLDTIFSTKYLACCGYESAGIAWGQVNETKVSSLIDSLHLDLNVDGQCLTYYPTAKANYNSLDIYGKEYFASTEEEAYSRLQAWATANGEVLSVDGIASGSSYVFGIFNNNNNTLIIVLSVVFVCSLLITSFLIYKKRKAQ